MTAPRPRQTQAAADPGAPWHERGSWKSAKALLEVFGILGGVLGVAMVAYQLWDAEQTRQTERALALVERFNGDSLTSAIETLRRATFSMNEQLPKNADAGFSDEMAQEIAIGLTRGNTPETLANQSALIQVARFFDEADLCVSSGLCDRRIVCLYLTPYAIEVDTTFSAGLAAVNARSDSSTGAGMSRVSQYAPCDP